MSAVGNASQSPIKYRVFNIGFRETIDIGDRNLITEDETQFDVVDGEFEDMARELLNLFSEFAYENSLHRVEITYVEEEFS